MVVWMQDMSFLRLPGSHSIIPFACRSEPLAQVAALIDRVRGKPLENLLELARAVLREVSVAGERDQIPQQQLDRGDIVGRVDRAGVPAR